MFFQNCFNATCKINKTTGSIGTTTTTTPTSTETTTATTKTTTTTITAGTNLFIEYLAVIDVGVYNFFVNLYGTNVSSSVIKNYIQLYFTQLVNAVIN